MLLSHASYVSVPLYASTLTNIGINITVCALSALLAHLAEMMIYMHLYVDSIITWIRRG